MHLRKTVLFLSATTLVCGLAVALTTRPAPADSPAEVVRTFAVVWDPGQPLPEYLDFLSDGSRSVVVAAPESNPESFQFTNSNSDSRFDSTVWEKQSALHITDQGKGVPGAVYWLLTPETPAVPPPGAKTFTGLDCSQVLSQEVIYIQDCTSGSCEDYSAERFKVYVSTPGSASAVLVVVTAVFSR